MADPRPYVINANVINLLNSAPVENMRPSLGSLVQRKTIDIGCYPFPFMVNSENIPLDGRTINGQKLPIRLVPFWCSENSYSDFYGDTSFNNGKIVWQGGFGKVESISEGNILGLSASFAYDSILGVTYPLVRYNTAFIGMDRTVPAEWVRVKEAVLGSADGLTLTFTSNDGETLAIANNVLFKVWSGLTFSDIQTGLSGTTYQFFLMEKFNSAGGTYSPFLDRYSYGCLDQILNSDRFAAVGLEPNSFWEGTGLSFGISGGMTGELFLLNAFTGGDQSGSYYVTPGATIDFPYDLILGGLTAGSTLSGKNLAINLYSLASEVPFLGPKDPQGGFIDTLALLLGTNQKIVTLVTGGTASLRALDFNNPCSASFVYKENTELGRWGYEVERIGIGQDSFDSGPPPRIGCNIGSFNEYTSGLNGSTGRNHGIYHPLSWMFWKGISFDGEFREYRLGYIHDFVGITVAADDTETPVYNRLEGIHDYLCYEYFEGSDLKERVYYPIRPITSKWYQANVAPGYTLELGGKDNAINYGFTLDQRFDTGFSDNFKGPGSVAIDGPLSVRSLDDDSDGITVDFENNSDALNGVTGVLFPLMIPIASFAMEGISGPPVGGGSLVINGEFDNFLGWNKAKFNLDGVTDPKLLYQYYADGVSSAADFSATSSSPYNVEGQGSQIYPDFRLFSWNALSRISPRDLQSPLNIVRSSFNSIGADNYGFASYTNGKKLSLNGTAVDVNLQNYPPLALPAISSVGLEYDRNVGGDTITIPLDCGSYINVIRYANNTQPDQNPTPGVFGLTATRKLIANVTLNATEKSFAEFDTTLQVDPLFGVDAPNFSRTVTSSNSNSNFYLGDNFFFASDPGNTRNVFASPYYLTAAEYLAKYGGDGGQGQSIVWWEDIDKNGLLTAAGWGSVDSLASDIASKLVFPNGSDNWANPTYISFGFRGESFLDPGDESQPNTTPGILAALNQNVHPAIVYRLFTTNVFRNLGIENDCAATWTSGGVPCHKLPSVINELKTGGKIYNSYFTLPNLCNNGEEFPTDEFDAKKGLDFFAGCAVDLFDPPGPQGVVFKYAYDPAGIGYPYSPFPEIPNSNPYYDFRNPNCGEGQNLPDPPLGATLTDFGIQFADVLNVLRVEGGSAAVELANAQQVRDVLFGFDGLTATINGITNDVGITTASNWLQGKLTSIFDYYNRNRTTTTADLAKVEQVLTNLYADRFPTYKDSLATAKVYKLFAIKPKCVEEWTPECKNMAASLINTNTYRFAAFAPSDMFFSDENFNADVPPSQRGINPPIIEYVPPVGNNTTVLTSSNIIPVNEGFLGAFRTVFIEPLGLAENVLATEAQAVPRATISSTVFGKITSVIDSEGFIRDVNLITFESGFGTKITGNNTSGAITISVDGLSLGSLSDVGISGASSGDILVYDAELAKWVNRPFADVVQPFLAGFTGGVAGTNFFYQDSAPDAGITIGSRWMNSNTGIEYIYISDGDSFQWIQSSVDVTAETPTFNYNTTLVTGSEYAALDTDYYIGVSYAGPVLIQLPSEPDQGKTVIVKDASGFASYENRKITVVGATGSDTIDNEASAIINVNNGALQFIYKNGWRII